MRIKIEKKLNLVRQSCRRSSKSVVKKLFERDLF